MISFSFCSHFVVAGQDLGALSDRQLMNEVVWRVDLQSSMFQIMPKAAPGRSTLLISLRESSVANLS